MPTPPMLVVRADGGPSIGAGHLARGFALLERWIAQGGRGTLVSRDVPRQWAPRFGGIGCAVVDAETRPQADWWAADGYDLTAGDRAGDGARVVIIDDHDTAGTGGTGADLVVDQNLGALASSYPAARAALVGPRYALVRQEVRDLGARRRESGLRPRLARLVVTMGGAPNPDVRALCEAVVRDPRLDGIEARVLSGAEDVVAPLLEADAAVAAAGSVTWELACAGVPSVLVAVAANQEPLAERLATLGSALYSEPQADSIVSAVLQLAGRSLGQREEMVHAGRALVDGHGASRVTAFLRGALVSLRVATAVDAAELHRWRNDPITRAGSFTTAEVSWSDHVVWLEERLANVDADLLVATDHEGEALGVVRFDAVAEGEVEIGVTIAPEQRGRGWAAALVEAGCRWVAPRRGPCRVLARVRSDNEASVRAFIAADFDLEPSEEDGTLLYARPLDGRSRGIAPHHPR